MKTQMIDFLKNLKKLGHCFLDVLFPPQEQCPFCGCFNQQCSVCQDCHSYLLQSLTISHCSCCGRFSREDLIIGELCRDCRRKVWFFTKARAVAPYGGIARSVVQNLKYKNQRQLVAPMARYMALLARREPVYQRVSAIVPVPMWKTQRKERGFNQAELLAYELSDQLGLPVLNCVYKSRETLPQAGLNRYERLENLQNVFVLKESFRVKNKGILIVDDVITTASTLEAVATVAAKGGAYPILGLAFAAGKTIFRG